MAVLTKQMKYPLLHTFYNESSTALPASYALPYLIIIKKPLRYAVTNLIYRWRNRLRKAKYLAKNAYWKW